MPNKILTVSELAEHLNVHRITIYRLLKNGSLPGFKIGRVWRFDLDEIGQWMSNGKSTAAIRAATDGDGVDGHGVDGHFLDGHGVDGRGVDGDGVNAVASKSRKQAVERNPKSNRSGKPPGR